MYQSETYLRVRYGETDQMGYVYYGNYALYYEEARTEAIRQIGITYKELEAMGVMMPVMELNIQYLRPAFYDENLRIVCTVKDVLPTDKEITFHGEIYNEKGKILNKGQVKLAFVDSTTRKKTTIPQLLFDLLSSHFTK